MPIPVIMSTKTHKELLKQLHTKDEVIAMDSSALIAYNLVALTAMQNGDLKIKAKITKGY